MDQLNVIEGREAAHPAIGWTDSHLQQFEVLLEPRRGRPNP